MFRATIISDDRTVYDGEVWSVILPGATGEFEILELHKPIVSLLRGGTILIDWKQEILIRRGAVKVEGDQLIAIVDE